MFSVKQVTIALVFISITPAMHADAFQNEPNGFRGVVWGSTISVFPNLNLILHEAYDCAVYAKDGDTLRIGGAELYSINYHFFQDRFYGVTMSSKMDVFNSAQYAKDLRNIIVRRFGPGISRDLDMSVLDKIFGRKKQETRWEGPVAVVQMVEQNKCVQVSIYSAAILREKSKYQVLVDTGASLKKSLKSRTEVERENEEAVRRGF